MGKIKQNGILHRLRKNIMCGALSCALALGMMLTTEWYLKMACIGMLAAAGYAGILLFICKKGRKTEIPLVPFLLLGYLGGFLL